MRPGRGVRLLILGCVVAGLYAALGPIRGVAEALRAGGHLETTVLVLAAFAGGLLYGVSRAGSRAPSGAPPSSTPVWLASVLAAGLLFTVWEVPEERVHLPQYVVVAILAWWALRPGLLAAVVAVLAIGVGDELVQAALPGRTFDLRDIVANAVAGLSALLLLRGGRAAWAAPGLLLGGWLFFTAVPPDLSGGGAKSIEDPLLAEAPGNQRAGSSTDEASSTAGPPAAGARFRGAPILLLTVDALRADHLSPWGRPPLPTPAFQRLAEESVAVRESFADSAWTSPGIVTLLTGLLPGVHGVEVRGVELNPEVRTLPEALVSVGYRTVGFAGEDAETYRNLGFQAVLDRTLEAPALLDAALTAVAGDDEEAPGVPWFAWLHLRSIHAPYDASPERLRQLGLPADLPDSPVLTRARTRATVPKAMFPGRHGWLRPAIRALYAAELADADTAVGAILAGLEGKGLLDEVILVVTADHGEELLEHHGVGHASTNLDSAPHPEIARIPVLIRLPGGEGAGIVHEGRWRQADLASTLAALVGAPEPGRTEAGPNADGEADNTSETGETVDWSRDLGRPDALPAGAGPDRRLLLSTSPCGWQCPDERRTERVHAWVDGPSWRFCRTLLGDPLRCDPAFHAPLQRQAVRRAVHPPVPSPSE